MVTINEQLAQAVAGEDAQATVEALQAGADPNTRFEGLTPVLYIAARFGLIEIVEALLRAGADPDVTYGDLTPEMVAESELRSILDQNVDADAHVQRLRTVLNIFRDCRLTGIVDRADAERRAEFQAPTTIEDEAVEFAWTMLSEEFGTNEFTLDDAANVGFDKERIARSAQALTDLRIMKSNGPGRFVLLRLFDDEADVLDAGTPSPGRIGEEPLFDILTELQCDDLSRTAGALERLESLPDRLDEPTPELADALTSLGTLSSGMRDEMGNNPVIAVALLGRCPPSPAVFQALESIVEGADYDIKEIALNELASKFDYNARLLDLIARNEFWVSKSALLALRSATNPLPAEDYLDAIALAAGLSETKAGAAYALSVLYGSDGCTVAPPEALVTFVVEELSDDNLGASDKANLFETIEHWRSLRVIDSEDDRILGVLRELTRSRNEEVRAKSRETLSRFTRRAPSTDETTPEQLARELVDAPLTLLSDERKLPAVVEGAAAVLYAVQCAAALATRRSRYPKCEQELVQRLFNAASAELSPDSKKLLRHQLSLYGKPNPDDLETDAQTLENTIPRITETYSSAIYESATHDIGSEEYRQLLIPLLELLKDAYWRAIEAVGSAWGGSIPEPESAPEAPDVEEFDFDTAARLAEEARRDYESRMPAVDETFALLTREFGQRDFTFNDVLALGLTQDDANFALQVLKDSGRLRTVALRTFCLEPGPEQALSEPAVEPLQDDEEASTSNRVEDVGGPRTRPWWQFWRE